MVLKSMPLRLASDGFVDKLATPKAYVFVAYFQFSNGLGGLRIGLIIKLI